MKELDSLYKSILLDHARNPRHYKKLEGYTYCQKKSNRLCGDEVEIFADIRANCIEHINFLGQGCSISQASASIMTEALQQLSLEDARSLVEKFLSSLKNEVDWPWSLDEDLSALQGVKSFPARMSCATLAWEIGQEILESVQ